MDQRKYKSIAQLQQEWFDKGCPSSPATGGQQTAVIAGFLIVGSKALPPDAAIVRNGNQTFFMKEIGKP